MVETDVIKKSTLKRLFSKSFFSLIVSIVIMIGLLFEKKTMHEYHSMHQIFSDVHELIIDYIKLFKNIHEYSNQSKFNILTIQLGEENLCLSATFNHFSRRADELQTRLQTQIRTLAQKRRNDILKGIDSDNIHQNQSYLFDKKFKTYLEENKSAQIIPHLQSIIAALEIYNEIQTEIPSTFRLLPIAKHIQKQVENQMSHFLHRFIF